MEQFHLISEWYYFAILSLATTERFNDDPKWIADNLKMRIRDVKKAIARLESLGLLAKNENGKLIATGKQFKTSNGIPNVYLRKHHVQGLDLARTSMEKDAFEVCDFSSMTMAIDPVKIPEAKIMITEFRRKLCSFLEADARKQVYRLSLQLFPLSNQPTYEKKETL